MIGIDTKFLGPLLNRAVEALESIAESAKELSLTAQAQRRILEPDTQRVDCAHADALTAPGLHLVGKGSGAEQPR
jgi:hypothetical protein